jgi:hypothetical protein
MPEMRQSLPVPWRGGLLVRELPDPAEGFPADHTGIQRLSLSHMPERIYFITINTFNNENKITVIVWIILLLSIIASTIRVAGPGGRRHPVCKIRRINYPGIY